MTINLCSPSVDECDSYGRLATELASWLDVFGHGVNRVGVPNVAFGIESCLATFRQRAIRPVLGGLLLGYPTLHHTYGAMVNTGPKVAITMFESTVLPEGWAEALNRADESGVPVTPDNPDWLALWAEVKAARAVPKVKMFLGLDDQGAR